jgi:hypothetical protein
MSSRWLSFALLILTVLVALPVAAQTTQPNYVVEVASPTGTATAASSAVPLDPGDVGEVGDSTKLAINPGGFPIPAPPFAPGVVWRQGWICRNAGPWEVTGFRITCNGGTFLDFHIADCCVPGDHWQLKGKAWDANPNTGVTTAPGPANLFGVAGRVFNYGGPPTNPNLTAYVECSYLNGVNIFLADSFVWFSSNAANCNVAPDPPVNRIDRAP